MPGGVDGVVDGRRLRLRQPIPFSQVIRRCPDASLAAASAARALGDEVDLRHRTGPAIISEEDATAPTHRLQGTIIAAMLEG